MCTSCRLGAAPPDDPAGNLSVRSGIPRRRRIRHECGVVQPPLPVADRREALAEWDCQQEPEQHLHAGQRHAKLVVELHQLAIVTLVGAFSSDASADGQDLPDHRRTSRLRGDRLGDVLERLRSASTPSRPGRGRASTSAPRPARSRRTPSCGCRSRSARRTAPGRRSRRARCRRRRRTRSPSRASPAGRSRSPSGRPSWRPPRRRRRSTDQPIVAASRSERPAGTGSR